MNHNLPPSGENAPETMVPVGPIVSHLNRVMDGVNLRRGIHLERVWSEAGYVESEEGALEKAKIEAQIELLSEVCTVFSDYTVQVRLEQHLAQMLGDDGKPELA